MRFLDLRTLTFAVSRTMFDRGHFNFITNFREKKTWNYRKRQQKKKVGEENYKFKNLFQNSKPGFLYSFIPFPLSLLTALSCHYSSSNALALLPYFYHPHSTMIFFSPFLWIPVTVIVTPIC